MNTNTRNNLASWLNQPDQDYNLNKSSRIKSCTKNKVENILNRVKVPYHYIADLKIDIINVFVDELINRLGKLNKNILKNFIKLKLSDFWSEDVYISEQEHIDIRSIWRREDALLNIWIRNMYIDQSSWDLDFYISILIMEFNKRLKYRRWAKKINNKKSKNNK